MGDDEVERILVFNSKNDSRTVAEDAFQIFENHCAEMNSVSLLLRTSFVLKDRLNGVIVVGTGLPMVNSERNMMKDFYNEKGKTGTILLMYILE